VPTPTPVPTFVSSGWQKPVNRPFGVDSDERWIDVDLSAQSLYAYEGNTLIFETLISSGLSSHPTVTGQFRVWYLTASQTMDGRRLGFDYYLPKVPYVMYFFEDYALHGTYWHNNFGNPMSHGCVNMRTDDAEWVFSWAEVGTVVSVHQ
jgi:lipoprotein-anchoring transpeptidase ErfK/SrfK